MRELIEGMIAVSIPFISGLSLNETDFEGIAKCYAVSIPFISGLSLNDRQSGEWDLATKSQSLLFQGFL